MGIRLKYIVLYRSFFWRRVCVAASLLFATGSVLAWDGAVTGYVSGLDTVNEPNNYEMRIYLGGATMCNVNNSSLSSFAYLNSSDPNYSATLANLMMAYSMGKQVSIFTMNDSGAGCHIHYVMVRN